MAVNSLPRDSVSETPRIFGVVELTIQSWLLVKCCDKIIDIGYFKKAVSIDLVDTHFMRLELS